MEDNIEMGNLNPPEGAEGGDEGAIAETPLDEDGFLSGLDGLDDAKTSSFCEENKDDSFKKRKRQLDELLYEEALKEHRSKAKSVVEEETGGETSRSGEEEIYEDAVEEFHAETTVVNENFLDDLEEMYRKEMITFNEKRELELVTEPKGPPETRIAALKIQRDNFKEKAEITTVPERERIMRRGIIAAEQSIDNERIILGLQPETEEGKVRFREIVRENVRTKFERFQKWARENLGALAAIAVSGIITTVVVAGKKTIVGASKGLGAVGKALANLAKSALPILVPILNLLSTILSWGAKGLAFLAKNLWIVAVLIAGAVHKYLQMKRRK
ncbi:Hypothetical predicted protein [Paramuricea clavata]|uniref:Uncharacterized protein n=1 Tax=Paramuricea clavata TaxID=317549 RepID=A0A7D9HJG5_PARCT|nr:Hypothetical predicted protein [Paramuricea clavata]